MRPRLALCLAALFLCLIASAFAQTTAPQTYTLTAQATSPAGDSMTFTIYRDGPRERIDTSFRGKVVSASLIDLQAHKVYWIGWSGPGSCSAGHYPGSRPPLSYDPVTAGLENLPKNPRKFVRTEAVNGIPTKLEEVVATKLADKARVWIADPGNFVVKIESPDRNGKPMIAYEIKQLSTAKPAASLLAPPADCMMTDSEMTEQGDIRAHAESTIDVKTSGTKKLGNK